MRKNGGWKNDEECCQNYAKKKITKIILKSCPLANDKCIVRRNEI